MALVCGFSIILQERKRMIDDLFKSVKSKDELLNLFSALIAFYDAKKNDYESVFGYFPSSKMALEQNYEKCLLSIKQLQDFKTEAQLLDFGAVINFQ
jgi:hypothetical protein